MRSTKPAISTPSESLQKTIFSDGRDDSRFRWRSETAGTLDRLAPLETLPGTYPRREANVIICAAREWIIEQSGGPHANSSDVSDRVYRTGRGRSGWRIGVAKRGPGGTGRSRR